MQGFPLFCSTLLRGSTVLETVGIYFKNNPISIGEKLKKETIMFMTVLNLSWQVGSYENCLSVINGHSIIYMTCKFVNITSSRFVNKTPLSYLIRR